MGIRYIFGEPGRRKKKTVVILITAITGVFYADKFRSYNIIILYTCISAVGVRTRAFWEQKRNRKKKKTGDKPLQLNAERLRYYYVMTYCFSPRASADFKENS